MTAIKGVPLIADRGAWDTQHYAPKHAADIYDTGVSPRYHWTEAQLDDTYARKDLVSETFETISRNLKCYSYAITYDGDDVDYITYDLGGGLSVVKTFNWTDGRVTSIVLSGDTPSGIDLTKTFYYTGDSVTSIGYA